MQTSYWGDRVSVTILRPPLNALQSCDRFLSPVFRCMKNSIWRLNFLCERSLKEISPALQAIVKCHGLQGTWDVLFWSRERWSESKTTHPFWSILLLSRALSYRICALLEWEKKILTGTIIGNFSCRLDSICRLASPKLGENTHWEGKHLGSRKHLLGDWAFIYCIFTTLCRRET